MTFPFPGKSQVPCFRENTYLVQEESRRQVDGSWPILSLTKTDLQKLCPSFLWIPFALFRDAISSYDLYAESDHVATMATIWTNTPKSDSRKAVADFHLSSILSIHAKFPVCVQ